MLCDFQASNFIYYSYTVVFFLSLLTAFMVLFRDKTSPINRYAFLFIILVAIWIVNVFARLVTYDANLNLFFWRISVLSVSIHLFFLYFSYHFTKTPISNTKKIVLALPFFFLLPWILTDYNAGSYHLDFVGNCDFIDGPLVYYYYFIMILYTIGSIRILCRRLSDSIMLFQIRAQLKILIFAITFQTVWMIVFKEFFRSNLLGGVIVEISPFFILGNFFFITLIAFAIIKCDLFEFNTVPTKTFTIALWSIIFFSMFFFEMSIAFILIYAIAYVALLLIFWKL